VNSLLPEDKNIFLFTGNYGSGKTEVSVNIVHALARSGKKVTIADLDLVNPYFRCREAREPMEKLGARVIAPKADMHNADLPILLPEVRGAIEKPDGISILDVGGDNVGATVLASLTTVFRTQSYEMYFVLNQNRPFTDTVDGSMQFMDEIEKSSRLKISGIVGNTHLMEDTDINMSKEGAEFCQKVADKRGIKTAFVTAPVEKLIEAGYLAKEQREKVDSLVEVDGFPVPVFPLKRIMLPPWLGGPVPGSMATHSRDGFARVTG